MDVFVIPAGSDRYELYYEHDGDVEDDQEPPSGGLLARLQRQFAELLRAAEEHPRRRAERAGAPTSWMGRMQDWLFSWIAERIAEQRLLWNLRRKTAAVAVHPEGVAFDEVLVHIRRSLQRDYERHRFWLVVDAIGLVLSWPLTVIPGPNVLLFYFLFRVGGHWMSMRGATQGRHRVVWTGRPRQWLDELAALQQVDPHSRRERVEEIASELHLRNLPVFFDRVTRGRKTR